MYIVYVGMILKFVLMNFLVVVANLTLMRRFSLLWLSRLVDRK
jgi:hypothetical protein